MLDRQDTVLLLTNVANGEIRTLLDNLGYNSGAAKSQRRLLQFSTKHFSPISGKRSKE